MTADRPELPASPRAVYESGEILANPRSKAAELDVQPSGASEERVEPAAARPPVDASPWSEESSRTVSRSELDASPLGMSNGVRLATTSDAEVVAALQSIARGYAFEQGLSPAPSHDDFDDLVSQWQRRLRGNSPASVFLALKDGEPAGFVAAGPSRSGLSWEGELYSLYVHPRFQDSRAADNLVVASLDFLAQQGFSAARVWVTPSNEPRIALLQRQGFRPLDRQQPPLGEGAERAFLRPL